jgi:hypothetical protein
MTKDNTIPMAMIAPCGMNCRLCIAYVREKNRCPGCLFHYSKKSPACVTCRIKNCEKRTVGKNKFCGKCDIYPCARLKQLDKRYSKKYGMSMLDNLAYIKEFGIRKFVKKETERWTCPQCGILLCVHKPQCLNCGFKWH